MKKNKTIGIIIISLIYIFTILCGVGLYFILPDVLKTQPLLTLLLIDFVCTIIIYLFSTIFKNASIYDPYWSVAPPIIFLAFSIMTGYKNLYITIFLVLVLLWSVRLTFNWGLNFKNLSIQDWRYQNFKDKHPKVFFLINLFGIHLFPTMIVYIGMIPGFFFMNKAVSVNLNVGTIIAFLLMLVATIIELISDIQMYNFRKNNKTVGKIMDKGLWKTCRHPNYFGEILFWASIWLAYFSAESDFMIGLVMAFCPIAIFMMFEFVSIPMLEKRQIKNKPLYKDYMEQTNGLWLYPLLKSKKE